MITIAKKSGANVAKFQKRNSKSLLTKKEYDQRHPEPWNSFEIPMVKTEKPSSLQ